MVCFISPRLQKRTTYSIGTPPPSPPPTLNWPADSPRQQERITTTKNTQRKFPLTHRHSINNGSHYTAQAR